MNNELLKKLKDSNLSVNEKKDVIQGDIINTWVKDFNGWGIACGFTGFGKTNTGIKAAIRYQKKFIDADILVLVPTTDLQIEWVQRMMGLVNHYHVFVLNTYTMSDKPIQRNYGLTIADEVHTMCNEESKYFSQAIQITNTSFLLGLSATLDYKHKQFLAKYKLHICYEVTLLEGIELDLVPPFTIYNIGCPLTDDEYEEYQKADYDFRQQGAWFATLTDDIFALAFACIREQDERTKKPIYSKVRIEGNLVTKTNKQWITFVANHFSISEKEVKTRANIYRNAMSARNDCLKNTVSKLLTTQYILENSKRKNITFVSDIDRANELTSIGKNIKAAHSKTAKKKRRDTIIDFRENKFNKFITVRAFDMGLDVVDIEEEIMEHYFSTEIAFQQRAGRSLRFDPNNTDKSVNIYCLYSIKEGEDKPFQDEVQLRKAQRALIGIKWIKLDQLKL